MPLSSSPTVPDSPPRARREARGGEAGEARDQGGGQDRRAAETRTAVGRRRARSGCLQVQVPCEYLTKRLNSLFILSVYYLTSSYSFGSRRYSWRSGLHRDSVPLTAGKETSPSHDFGLDSIQRFGLQRGIGIGYLWLLAEPSLAYWRLWIHQAAEWAPMVMTEHYFVIGNYYWGYKNYLTTSVASIYSIKTTLSTNSLKSLPQHQFCHIIMQYSYLLSSVLNSTNGVTGGCFPDGVDGGDFVLRGGVLIRPRVSAGRAPWLASVFEVRDSSCYTQGWISYYPVVNHILCQSQFWISI